MTKALITFAVGDEHSTFSEITFPRMRRYAELHGYEFFDCSGGSIVEERTRPASWCKVPLLLDRLRYFDEVLWLDCDVFIAVMEFNIGVQVHPSAIQALVLHNTPAGYIPNCGVWVVRKPMIEHLEHMWQMTRYMNHPWWEQAALISCMGGNPSDCEKFPAWEATGELDSKTHWLDYSWNTHPCDLRRVGTGHRFYHATKYPERLKQLQLWEEMYGNVG